MAKTCQCISPKPAEWVEGKVVGSGSFGIVHLAMDKATGSLFVIKSSESESGIESLKHETIFLENLDSPYIVKCLGKDFSSEQKCVKKFNLFIEYMAGGSLTDVVENFGGAVHEDFIRLYTEKILQGLNYLHENGIVHCDVKCKNVLLGLSGNVKLADFGFAKKINDLKVEKKSLIHLSKSNIIGGTPLWMAPEVLRNEGLDFAADIWSLGCTVIEMANGCRPPWGIVSNPMATILKIATSNEIPQFPSNLSQEGLNFLSKCLERDPKKRWTAKELLKHPFVLGKFTNSINEEKDASSSPASVFHYYYDSDESVSDNDEFMMNRVNPFSMRAHPNKRLVSGNQLLSSSGDWITVRTTSV